MAQIVQLTRKCVLTISFFGLLSCSGGSSSSQTAAQSTQVPDVASTAKGTTTSTIDPLVQNFVTTTTSPKVQESDGRVFVAGGNYSGLKPKSEGNSFDFSKFDLQGATFSGAVLDGADLYSANLTKSNLSRAKLTCRIIGGIKIQDIYLPFETICAKLNFGIFVDADLSFAKMNGVFARNADFTRANLSNADISYYKVRNDAAAIDNLENNFDPCANLAFANFTTAKLVGTNLECANLISAIMINADLSNANLIGANLSGADLSGANLKGAKMADAVVTGTKFTGTVMPDGTKHP